MKYEGGSGEDQIVPSSEIKLTSKNPALLGLIVNQFFFKYKRQLFEMMLCDII